MSRCIIIKKDLIEFVEQNLTGYTFSGSEGYYYGFSKKNEDNLYYHIVIEKDFLEGNICLCIKRILVCYESQWWETPWHIVCMESDIVELINGWSTSCFAKWYSGENSKEGLLSVLKSIKDVYFNECAPILEKEKSKLSENKLMRVTVEFLESIYIDLSDVDIRAIKKWLRMTISEYSKIDKNYCKENTAKSEREKYLDFCLRNPHPLFGIWTNKIIELYGLNFADYNIEKDIMKYCISSFKNRYERTYGNVLIKMF